MSLTPSQINYLRDNSTDDKVGVDGYILDATTVQAIYDDADQGDSDLNLTLVWILRRLVSMAARKIAITNPVLGTTEQQQQYYEHLVDRLAYWESLLGLGGGQSLGTSATRVQRADANRTYRTFAWQADSARVRYLWGHPDDD